MMKYAMLMLLLLLTPSLAAGEMVRIGSKKFTEGYLVSEILAQLIEGETALQVERKFGLGGTNVCFEALRTGAIDLYPEYTGTAIEVILQGQCRSSRNQVGRSAAVEGGDLSPCKDWEGLKRIFQKQYGLVWLEPLGFNNTYALAMAGPLAESLGVHRLSDLRRHPELRYGLSHEFLNRADGWSAVSQVYSLTPHEVTGLDHGLAYESIAGGKIDLIDAYSTDAKINKFGLRLLEDDLNFFPKYLAAPLVRGDLLIRHPEIVPLLGKLVGKISEVRMQGLNAQVEIEGKSFAEVASQFLEGEGLKTATSSPKQPASRGLVTLIVEHLMLTFVSVGLATLLGVPVGIWISRRRRLSQLVLAVAGVAQTIPGIALLVFMIPIFGIGKLPAIVALFIYGLLPIVRNCCTGLREVSPVLLEAADGIGLTRGQRLFYVEIPLATRMILAGIRTSAVINIGTATLAAFIGAGGLGEPIVTGLALNNTRIVLSGAIPAALLAILTELAFEGIEGWVTPRGLRVS